MPHAECPHCEAKVKLHGTPQIGYKVTCSRCGEKLEVFSLDPVEFDYEYDYEYDGDYDEYDEEDY